MPYDSGATQKVKEKMREAMTRHFTESGDGAQVGEAAFCDGYRTLEIVPFWVSTFPNRNNSSENPGLMPTRLSRYVRGLVVCIH
jgi:hypothetical protein